MRVVLLSFGNSEALHKAGDTSPASLSLLAYGPVWNTATDGL